MLRFLVHVAAHTAVHAAHKSRVRAQKDARARAAMPFELRPGYDDGDCALLVHKPTGFAHLLPGHPEQDDPTRSIIEHPHDAFVSLGALPVCVRYHVTCPHLRASSAQELAMQVAASYIGWRAGSPPAMRPADPPLLQAWSADAGALAAYDLSQPDPFGADREELVVAIRAGYSMAISYRYPRSALHWIGRAFFASAANASLSWAGVRLQTAKIWPIGSFLATSLPPQLIPARMNEAWSLATQMALAPPERDVLATRLATILNGDDPPWQPMLPDRAAWAVAFLAESSRGPGLRAVVERQMQSVVSAHDLRGLALQLGQALEVSNG